MAANPPLPSPTPISLLTAQHSTGHTHLIIGSNPLAASRATQSLSAGAKPILISPTPPEELHYSLTQYITSGQLTHLSRPFESTDLFTLGREEVDNVVDAVFITLSPKDSSVPQISTLCKKNRIPVNVVDCPSLCSFSLLSTHLDGPLQIGVTTNGRGCKLASRIRREIAASLPQGLGSAVARLGDVRRRIIAEDKSSSSSGLDSEGLDDSVDQTSDFNKLVLEGKESEEEQKTRRMRWLSQVCEYWPLRRLAAISEEEILEGVLNSYHQSQQQKPSLTGGDGPRDKIGRVILAGSGPGHPDLLTRATYKAIQSADLILADKLVPAGVLDLIPRRTPVSIAKKFPGNADRAQEEFLEQALVGVKEGKTVLRLKQGDPFIYGRGGEEVQYFRQHGLGDRVVVLPGITSSLSAPLFAGVPPTQRDVADQVLVCTGTGKKGKAPVPPEFVESRTVVFLMALHRITGLVAELTEYLPEEQEAAEVKGRRKLWPVDTPCAVIERASCPDQRVIRTTLKRVAEAIEQEGSRPPGLLVVGRACEVLYTPEKGRSWLVEDGFKGLDLEFGNDFAAGALGVAGLA
ncbi:uroporphyrin-III C-methyltransferase [Podospora bellae-mahoneyi]|uniref:precorrin-2 dehydrogenase n=1 Tax=Podospora bellae-mahoneyi TaxID=2093777 RepID=A0ABR0FZY5_9PEZI|nr:uroporphyrin-III C-methyltransferase [Podospora bellae-mahoneyi]